MRTILESIGIALIVLFGWLAFHNKHQTIVSIKETTISPELAKVDKVEITPKKVIVYAPAAKVKLPTEIKEEQSLAVLGSTILPPSEKQQSIYSLLNVDTGESKIIVTEKPDPWLSVESRKMIQISYGVKNFNNTVGRIEFTDDLVQIKNSHFGINASLDTDGTFFAGVGVNFRF